MKVIIDLRGALLTLERKTGKKKTVTETSKKYDVTTTTFQNWDVQAPKDVVFIFEEKADYKKFYGSKSVNFLKEFLNDNKEITFNDLVKEV